MFDNFVKKSRIFCFLKTGSLTLFFTTASIVSFSTIVSTYKFAFENRIIAEGIYKKYKEDNLAFISHNSEDRKVFVVEKKTKNTYSIVNNEFVIVENHKFDDFFKARLFGDVYVQYPSFVSYDFSESTVYFDVLHKHCIDTLLFTIIFISSILFNIVALNAAIQNSYKLKTLKISVQEFALAQRTISHFVRIIHHKLNTPIKVLTTQTRMIVSHLKEGNLITEESEKDAGVRFQIIEVAIKSISEVNTKLKSYNDLNKKATNCFKLMLVAKEAIDILKDDTFVWDVDNRLNNYYIDTTLINPYEVIQIFMNQIKFSLYKVSSKIIITVLDVNKQTITLLYSDNGNYISDEVKKLIKADLTVSDLTHKNLDEDKYDLMLNFILLNNKTFSSMELLSSTNSGNIFRLKLPIISVE